MFSKEDFELFARYPTSKAWPEEVQLEDQQRFKSVRDTLKTIVERAASDYKSVVRMKTHASLYSPNGRSATDLWACIFPSTVSNKSFGLQFAIILSSAGAEICFCFG